MKIGLYMNTHGIGATVGDSWTLQPLPVQEMRLREVAVAAEEAGFDSLWFSDHVLMTPSPESQHTAADPVTGTRAYPADPELLDAIVSMAVVATVTSRVRLAPSVWISPYRHPLQDVRQLTSIDHVSDGRLITAVGSGWMKEEFRALGVPYEERVSRLEECVKVYKQAWTEKRVSFKGQHYSFTDVCMDPKPRQSPRPPIYYGGVTKAGLRLAARLCDGFYPTFTDPGASANRYEALLATLPAELEKQGRGVEEFALLAVASSRVSDEPAGRMGFTKGSTSSILGDLESLAEQGFSMTVLHLDSLDGSFDEWRRQLELVGERIIPGASRIGSNGAWAVA